MKFEGKSVTIRCDDSEDIDAKITNVAVVVLLGGGWVVSQVDIAGAIPAMRRAKGRVATVSVNSFQFKQPVSVGDVVSFYAEIVRVGKTSLHVKVEVFAERSPADLFVVKVTEAELTYVAIDAAGQKRQLPSE